MPFDVVVVGAGAVGRTAAWALAQTGRNVAVVDPHPGSGASYAAAGMLAPVTEAAYGEEDVVAVALRSLTGWPGFAAAIERASGLATGFEQSGTLLVAADASDRAHLEEIYAFHRSLGLASELVPPSRARVLEPLLSPTNRGGVFAAGDAQVDNRRLLAALATAGQRAGVADVADRAIGIVVAGGRATGVQTEQGMIDGGLVVLAAGHGSATFSVEGYRTPTRPVKGQILRLATPAGSAPMTRTVRALVGGFSVYVVPRTGGQVVIGATQEDVGLDDRVTVGGVHGLLRDALRILPSLHEFEITDVRVGFRPGSPDNAAIVGQTPVPGLIVATGHHRNGLLYLPVTAELLVGAADGEPSPLWAAPLDPSRFAARTASSVGS